MSGDGIGPANGLAFHCQSDRRSAGVRGGSREPRHIHRTLPLGKPRGLTRPVRVFDHVVMMSPPLNKATERESGCRDISNSRVGVHTPHSWHTASKHPPDGVLHRLPARSAEQLIIAPQTEAASPGVNNNGLTRMNVAPHHIDRMPQAAEFFGQCGDVGADAANSIGGQFGSHQTDPQRVVLHTCPPGGPAGPSRYPPRSHTATDVAHRQYPPAASP